MNENLKELDSTLEPKAQMIGKRPYKIGSSAWWDEKVTERQFYEEVLPFDNDEIDMYEIVPMCVDVRS